MQTQKTKRKGINTAVIFAAGLGTRLKEYTEALPKALVEVNHRPLLYYVINNLKQQGIKRFVINLHHFPDKIKQYLSSNNNFDAEIVFSDESNLLLETGGGLLNALPYFENEDTILVYNVDILCDANIERLFRFHTEKHYMATLLVSNRESSRKLFFDEEGELSGWKNYKTNQLIECGNLITERAFCGIHLVDIALLKEIPLKGKFSIIDAYLKIAPFFPIGMLEHSGQYWFDVGKPETLEEANKFIIGRLNNTNK